MYFGASFKTILTAKYNMSKHPIGQATYTKALDISVAGMTQNLIFHVTIALKKSKIPGKSCFRTVKSSSKLVKRLSYKNYHKLCRTKITVMSSINFAKKTNMR